MEKSGEFHLSNVYVLMLTITLVCGGTFDQTFCAFLIPELTFHICLVFTGAGNWKNVCM